MLFKVFDLLSDNELENLDEEIQREILPYIKLFESLPASIKEQAVHKAHTLTPLQYFSQLSDAWNSHNKLAHRIDKYLTALLNNRTTIERNVSKSKKLITLAFQVEEEKRILSAGIKFALDKFEKHLLIDGLNEDDVLRVLTPNKILWTTYYSDHLNYISLSNSKKGNILKKDLINKYHAGSEVIFAKRLATNFKSEINWGIDKIGKVVDSINVDRGGNKEKIVEITKNYSDAVHVNNLVSYDNYEEYLYGYNHYGYPDFLFRKSIVAYLVNRGLIDKRESILFYKEEDILDGLDKITIPTMETPIKLNLEPNIYLQTTPTTCGVACMMMGLNFFIGTPLNKAYESKLRKKLKLNRYDLVPALNLARFIKSNDFNVEIYHQDSFKFWRFIKEVNEDIFQQQEKIFGYATKENVKPRDKEISSQVIKTFLDNGYMLIMGVELSWDVKHAILIYDFEDNNFLVIDPLIGKRKYSEENLMSESNMNTGRWFIAFNYIDNK